jgi:hypothetical protein
MRDFLLQIFLVPLGVLLFSNTITNYLEGGGGGNSGFLLKQYLTTHLLSLKQPVLGVSLVWHDDENLFGYHWLAALFLCY